MFLDILSFLKVRTKLHDTTNINAKAFERGSERNVPVSSQRTNHVRVTFWFVFRSLFQTACYQPSLRASDEQRASMIIFGQSYSLRQWSRFKSSLDSSSHNTGPEPDPSFAKDSGSVCVIVGLVILPQISSDSTKHAGSQVRHTGLHRFRCGLPSFPCRVSPINYAF